VARPATGSSAPSFELEVLEGSGAAGSLADARGEVVVIEFWATYCGWCRSTHADLAKLARQADGNIRVLGITAQNRSRVTRYLRKKGSTGLDVLHDPRGRVSLRYAAVAVPTLVVIDRQGVVRYWGRGAPAARSAIAIARRLASAAP